jgi:hypothetical protein
LRSRIDSEKLFFYIVHIFEQSSENHCFFIWILLEMDQTRYTTRWKQ